MKTLFILIILPIFLFFTVTFISAQQDDYQKGLTYYQKHNYKASIKHLKVYVEKTADPKAYYLLGYGSYMLKDYIAAQKYFREAYLIDPQIKMSTIKASLLK